MGVQSSELCFPEASSLVHPLSNPCCSEDFAVDQESDSSSSVGKGHGFESEAEISTTLSSSDYDLLYQQIEGLEKMKFKERVRPRTRRKSCRSAGEKRGKNVSGSRRACNCAVSFAADCAAICCCPCAILHLLVLAFVKAPSVFARKAFCFAKKKARSNRKPEKNDENDRGDDDDNRQKSQYFTPPWSPQTSGPLEVSLGAKLDNQKIWSEFYAAGRMGFGGLPFEWN